MERKGIISERCEINRQIKANNALLRELKKELPIYHVKRHKALVVRIAELTELDRALKQYAELKEQAKEFDPVELYKARRDIRPAQEKTAEERQVRQMVMQRQAAQQKRSLRSAWKKNDFER